MATVKFNEIQRFRTAWAWVGVIAFNLMLVYAIIHQVVLHKPFGSQPVSNGTLILLEMIPLLLLFFLLSIRLKTTINDEGIYYRYFPFQRLTTYIKWEELNDAYIRHYNSVLEYGGYGIRKGTSNRGSAINTSASSSAGLQLQFRNGALLLIGTCKAEEIQKIINDKMVTGRINRKI